MKHLTAHIHPRIKKMADEAIAKELIEECTPVTAETQVNPVGYSIRKKGELVSINYTPIAAAVLLLSLLNPETGEPDAEKTGKAEKRRKQNNSSLP